MKRLLCFIGLHDYARTGQCNRCGRWEPGHPIVSPPPADFNQVMEAELEAVNMRRRAAWGEIQQAPQPPPIPEGKPKRYRSIDDP